MNKLIDIFLHLDRELAMVIGAYGSWTYALLFLIVFCETGFVVTPFLPGDSLLFAAGAFAATGALDIYLVTILLIIAATIGDTVNYWIGFFIGPKIFTREESFFFRRHHLVAAQHFYEKHGGKTIIIARFMPIIRTFAPFVAGIGKMSYGRFLLFNVTGGILWVTLFVFGGYFVGNIPVVKENFHYVIIAIVVVSVLPGIIRLIRREHTPPSIPPTP